MGWIGDWIQGIIIAVIISTIIEMILPEGTSKKYIKVVIGVYILFSMISPVINKVTGKDFRVSDIFDLDEYIEVSKNGENMKKNLEDQNQDSIKEIYISSLKNDIKEKIENKEYKVNDIQLEVENNDTYALKSLRLIVSKVETNKTNKQDNVENQNSINTIEKVEVNIGNTQNISNENTSKSNNKQDISSQDKKELKSYLSNVYEISIKNIFINE